MVQNQVKTPIPVRPENLPPEVRALASPIPVKPEDLPPEVQALAKEPKQASGILEGLASGVTGVLHSLRGTATAFGIVKPGPPPEETPIPSVTQIRNVGDAVNWIITNAASQVPFMGAVAASGAAGAVLGGPVGATVGALIGAFMLNAGETYNELASRGVPHEQARNTALPIGTLKAGLDVVTPLRFLGKIKLIPRKVLEEAVTSKATSPALKKFASEALKGVATEVPTEVAQELLDIQAVRINKIPVAGEEILERVINAGAAAAVVGGLFGGAGGVIEHFATRPSAPSPAEPSPVQELAQIEAVDAQSRTERLKVPSSVVDTGMVTPSSKLDELTIQAAPLAQAIKEALPEGVTPPHLAIGPKVSLQLQTEEGARPIIHVEDLNPVDLPTTVRFAVKESTGIELPDDKLGPFTRPEMVPIVQKLQEASREQTLRLAQANEILSRLVALSRSPKERRAILDLVNVMGYEHVQMPKVEVKLPDGRPLEVFQVGEGGPRPIEGFSESFSSLPESLQKWLAAVDDSIRLALDAAAQSAPQTFGLLREQYRGIRLGIDWPDASTILRLDPRLDGEGFHISVGPAAALNPHQLTNSIAHELAHTFSLLHGSQNFQQALLATIRAMDPARPRIVQRLEQALQEIGATARIEDPNETLAYLFKNLYQFVQERPRKLPRTGQLRPVSEYRALWSEAREFHATKWDFAYSEYLERLKRLGLKAGFVDTTGLFTGPELSMLSEKYRSLLEAYTQFWEETSPAPDLPPPPLQIAVSSPTEIQTSYGILPIVRAAGAADPSLPQDARTATITRDLSVLYGAETWQRAMQSPSYRRLVHEIVRAADSLGNDAYRLVRRALTLGLDPVNSRWWDFLHRHSADPQQNYFLREITDEAAHQHLLRHPDPTGTYYLVFSESITDAQAWRETFHPYLLSGEKLFLVMEPTPETVKAAFKRLKNISTFMNFIRLTVDEYLERIQNSPPWMRRYGTLPKIRVAYTVSPVAAEEMRAYFVHHWGNNEATIVFTGNFFLRLPSGVVSSEEPTLTAWALNVVKTVIHELSHITAFKHDQEFSQTLREIDALDPEMKFGLANALARITESIIGRDKKTVDEIEKALQEKFWKESYSVFSSIQRRPLDRSEIVTQHYRRVYEASTRLLEAVRPAPLGARPGQEAQGRLSDYQTPGPVGPPTALEGRSGAAPGSRGGGPTAGLPAAGRTRGQTPSMGGGERWLDPERFAPGSWKRQPADDAYFEYIREPRTPEPDPQLSSFVGAQALPPSVQQDVQQTTVRFGWFSKWALHILQWADRNPHIEPLRRYVDIARGKWLPYKTSITSMAYDRLTEWSRLGVRRANILSEMLLQATEKSETLGRPLTQEEINELAKKLGADKEVMWVFHRVLGDLKWVLNTLEQELIEESNKLGGDTIDKFLRETEIRIEFARLRDRTYFPMARFGKYMVVIKAKGPVTYEDRRFKEGDTVEVTSWERLREAKAYQAEMLKKFPADAVQVKVQMAGDAVHNFTGFPPSLFRQLASQLELSDEQKVLLKDIMYRYAPGRSFVKYLRRRRGIKGFSRDAQRAYASYMRSVSNHLPRLKYRWELEQAISDLKELAAKQPLDSVAYDRLVSEVNRHYEYLMNPGHEFAVLRGGLFLWYFGFNPKQILVNLTQLPLFTYPYLADTYGDRATVRELSRAIAHISKPSRYMENLSDVADAVRRAVKEGFINESYATEVSAYAERQLLTRALPLDLGDRVLKPLLDWATYGFRLSEEFMRRVTFVATYRLAAAKGAGPEEAFRLARKAVDDTMFEYTRLARPRLMRGIAAPFFVFRMFLQNALYYSFTGKEGQFSLKSKGGWRYWLGMGLLGGLAGLPFAKNIADLLKLLLTKAKELLGSENPYTDLLLLIRRFLAELGTNPDYLVDGLSKYSLGLVASERLFGVPFPAFNIAPSIQMGYVLPTEPLVAGLLGEREWKEAVLGMILETAGAGASTMTTMAKAMMTHGSDSLYTLRVAAPAVVRNIARAAEYLSLGAATDSHGRVIVKFDLHNPGHIAEIVGQALGFQPTRVAVEAERNIVLNDMVRYYTGRRSAILSAYTRAIATKDREAAADARREIVEFNRTAPREFRITARELAESLRTRVKNTQLRLRGYPLSKELVPLARELRQAYPPVSAPRQPTPQ